MNISILHWLGFEFVDLRCEAGPDGTATAQADDVFACAALKIVFFTAGVEFIRTRDLKVLDACDIVVLLTDGFTPWPTRKDLQKKSLIVVLCGKDNAVPPPEYRYPTVVVDQEGAKTIAK